MRYTDYEVIHLLKDYVITNKNDMEYIQNNKKGLIATIPEIDKKINEYNLQIQKLKNELEFYNNKKEAYKTIKNELLNNGIVKNGVWYDTYYYDIYYIIDNNNMELYRDIIQVYKTRISEYNKSLEYKKRYFEDFKKIKNELQKMIIKVA